MDTRKTPTEKNNLTPTKSSLHINLKTSLQAAEQVRQFLSSNRGFLFVLALSAYSVYKLVSGKINKREVPVINPDKPSLYGWYSADFPTGIKGITGLVDHMLPINSKIGGKIKSGMTVGVLQCPITLFSVMLPECLKTQVSEVDAKEKTTKVDCYNFNDIRKCINALFDEFVYGGCAVIALWSAFTKLGLKSNYALAGSALVTHIINGSGQKEGLRLSTFTQGIISSGLTLFHKGDLWPAAAAHVSHELLIAKLNLSK